MLLSHNNLSTDSIPRYAPPLGVGVEEEQTEGSNDILNYPPTTSPNPNHEPLPLCVLLSHNNLSTNSLPRYAQPLGVGVEEEQTEGSNDIVKCPPLSLLNPNHEP